MKWECSECGRSANVPDDASEVRCPCRPCDPRSPGQCEHFISWTDRTALSTCGCKSIEKLGTPTTIAECGLHGDVTPLAKKTKEGLPSCLGCPDFRQ